MRIPAENLAFYLLGNDKTALPEKKGPEPVDASHGVRTALSQSFREQRKKLAEENMNRQKIRRLHGNDERRKTDRRKQKLPVFLDTRLSPRRTESDQNSVIDFEI